MWLWGCVDARQRRQLFGINGKMNLKHSREMLLAALAFRHPPPMVAVLFMGELRAARSVYAHRHDSAVLFKLRVRPSGMDPLNRG